jgi:alkanesulfonate monooxygenase SsuD/methylene tetrahydromethanopterin reductase-like flavin-dependent oxidoreductase (luciferase family)
MTGWKEFIAVCRALWSSVGPEAFVRDRLNGLVADPAKIRPINHVGRFFKVKGPLSVVPSPQGHPVLIQAGGSKRGIWAAAGFVDHVFGAGKGIRLMAQQRCDIDAALRERGRDPDRSASFGPPRSSSPTPRMKPERCASG